MTTDKQWIERLLDRKFEDLKTQLIDAQRNQERRKLMVNGNIPSALTTLDIRIDELIDRIRKLET
jgi:hypothetical protein